MFICAFRVWGFIVAAIIASRIGVTQPPPLSPPRFTHPLHPVILCRSPQGCLRAVALGIILRGTLAACRIAERCDAGHGHGQAGEGRVGAEILFAGRLCYYKGVEVLLDAASNMDGHVTIIGDGPWRAKLQAQARRAQLGERVCFRGAVSEQTLIAQMQSSQVFVFPSTERSEAFGIAQLKAMACGLPVVSSDLPGVSWLNRHHQTGLNVPVRDAKALACAVNRLLSDNALRMRLAEGAREWAQEFTVERMARKTKRVYDQVR